MSFVDIAMDMETLGRIATGMKIPKELHTNYTGLVAYLEENCATHPDYQKAKDLAKSIQTRLQDQAGH